MKIALLAAAESWYTRDLQRAILQANHSSIVLPHRALTASLQNPNNNPSKKVDVRVEDQLLNDCDALIVRSMPLGSLEQVIFRMDVLWTLESQGLQIINSPKALECAIDKYLSLVRLQAASIVVPETILCESTTDAITAFDSLGQDVVIKPLFGSEGRGIVRIFDPEILWRTTRTLEQMQSVIYLQKWIPNDGTDYRILVLDGKSLGAIRRHSTTDFRTNIAQSAIAEKIDFPDPALEKIAIDAVAAVGAKFGAVDIMLDIKNGGTPIVLEVNGVPGWRAFSKTTGIDVASELISIL